VKEARRSGILAVAALVLSLCTPPLWAAPSDPAAVVQQFTDALNRHDADATMRLIARGGMVQSEGPPQSEDQVRAWVEQLIAEDVQVQLEGGPRVAWDVAGARTQAVVNWSAKLSLDRYRAVGFASVRGTVGAVVVGDRITFLRIWPDPDWQATGPGDQWR
jgi:hypothetical protein